MVIYRTADGQPGYHQAEELDEAVRFVERLRNGDGVDGARIFRMEEVNFDFRPYFKVEIGPGSAIADTPVAPAFAGRELGFGSDLGLSAEAPAPAFEVPAPAFEAPAPVFEAPAPAFEAPAPAPEDETWNGADVTAEVPAEVPDTAAELDLDPEPVPSFVAPPSVADPSVIDALPGPTTEPNYDLPAPAEAEEVVENGVSGRRGLFGR